MAGRYEMRAWVIVVGLVVLGGVLLDVPGAGLAVGFWCVGAALLVVAEWAARDM